MPRGSHPNSRANLVKFSATHQPVNGGRKPSKLKKYLKENNVSNEDVGRMIRNVLFNFSLGQLQNLQHDRKKPMIIRLFARAFLADWERGSLQNFQTFVERSYGAPKVEVNVSGGLDITVLSPQDRRARIDELLAALEYNRQPAAPTTEPQDVEQVDTPE